MCFLLFRIVEKHHSVEFSAKRGRLSAEQPPSSMSEKHFVYYIPPTEKKTNPARDYIIWYSNRDKKKVPIVCQSFGSLSNLLEKKFSALEPKYSSTAIWTPT
ncbi:hypothetical protein TNCV_844501 [Trichonephila clavipes]|uniref:Uncharacterized protein n=1 Tax=Trichonephila clavipes TaxID=2585209 RepID=A0A8X6WJ32_TRICX|nr:hypothetical protein TNCV_844501 [Trichonephila clavipes]